MIITGDTEKNWQNSAFFNEKYSQQTKYRKNAPPHLKDYLWQDYN